MLSKRRGQNPERGDYHHPNMTVLWEGTGTPNTFSCHHLLVGGLGSLGAYLYLLSLIVGAEIACRTVRPTGKVRTDAAPSTSVHLNKLLFQCIIRYYLLAQWKAGEVHLPWGTLCSHLKCFPKEITCNNLLCISWTTWRPDFPCF